MDIVVPRSRLSNGMISIDRASYGLNTKLWHEINSKIVDELIDELYSKKVLFLHGGIGRLTNYARSIGIDAYCLDLSKMCETLARENYPSVPFIRADTSNPQKGWDAVFIEDTNCGPEHIKFLKTASVWQDYATIYPKTLTFYIYRFNSKYIDEAFNVPEVPGKTARAYYKKILDDGHVRIKMDKSEVEDLEIEEHTFDLNAPLNTSVYIPPNTTHSYQGIGQAQWRMYPDTDKIDMAIYNKGYFLKLPHEGALTWTGSPEHYNLGKTMIKTTNPKSSVKTLLYTDDQGIRYKVTYEKL